MGHLCFGSGGTILPTDFVPGAEIPDLYLDWSKDYPGSEPPPVGEVPTGDPPVLGDQPPAGTDLDAWALPILANALYRAAGKAPTQAAIQAVQAISRLESGYGWPFFPSGVSARTGRDGRNWWGHHNWGSLLCYSQVGGETVTCYHNGGCLSGFYDLSSAIQNNTWVQVPACFAHWNSNEQGAAAFVDRLLGSDPKRVLALLDSGDLSLIATDLRIRQIFVRTRNADQVMIYQDAAWYVSKLMAHARLIARLYDGGLQLRAGALSGMGVTDPSEPPGLSELPTAGAPSHVGAKLLGLVVGAGVSGLAWAIWRRVRRDK